MFISFTKLPYKVNIIVPLFSERCLGGGKGGGGENLGWIMGGGNGEEWSGENGCQRRSGLEQ